MRQNQGACRNIQRLRKLGAGEERIQQGQRDSQHKGKGEILSETVEMEKNNKEELGEEELALPTERDESETE